MPPIRSILLLCLALTAVPGYAGELEDYIAHVREVRMSAGAEMALETMAALLLGQMSLTYAPAEDSEFYAGSFTSMACPNPDADPDQTRREREAQDAAIQALLPLLHEVADADASGFVTDAEGSTARHWLETGYLAHTLAGEGDLSLAALGRAQGAPVELAGKWLQGYARMHAALAGSGLEWQPLGCGLPPVHDAE